MKNIEYPYIPEDRIIKYVDKNNQYMKEASYMMEKGGCFIQKTGAVIVSDGKIIGKGNNASKTLEYCPRRKNGSKTGEDYYLCKEVCGQFGHAESNAIYNAVKNLKIEQKKLKELENLINIAYYSKNTDFKKLQNEIIEFTKTKNIEKIKGADLYLDGHWWCCKVCWIFMNAFGIRDVYLRNDSFEKYCNH
ncbi:hypothetical protein K9L04_00910 [Patescibacteria group bacterium]|nr:hypothetical protein [Patescibacteria group bacterium]